jgi:hypothetical protein
VEVYLWQFCEPFAFNSLMSKIKSVTHAFAR